MVYIRTEVIIKNENMMSLANDCLLPRTSQTNYMFIVMTKYHHDIEVSSLPSLCWSIYIKAVH